MEKDSVREFSEIEKESIVESEKVYDSIEWSKCRNVLFSSISYLHRGDSCLFIANLLVPVINIKDADSNRGFKRLSFLFELDTVNNSLWILSSDSFERRDKVCFQSTLGNGILKLMGGHLS